MKTQLILLVMLCSMIILSGCGPFKQTKAAIGPPTVLEVTKADAKVVIPDFINGDSKYRRIEIFPLTGIVIGTDARYRPPTVLKFGESFTTAEVAEIQDFFLRDWYDIDTDGVIVHKRWKHFSNRMMQVPPQHGAELGLTGLHGVWYQGN